MCRLWSASPVISRDVRHKLEFVLRQPGNLRIGDKIKAVLMIRSARHKSADFVKQRRHFKKQPIPFIQCVLSRKLIEELCEVSLSVYGKTVGVIGEATRVAMARRAVENLLAGSPHAKVYQWMERERRRLRAL